MSSTITILRTVVDLTFLLLAVVLIVVVLKGNKEREVVDTARYEVAITKKELSDSIGKAADYLERRVNASEGRQDTYQTSTSRRLDVLEERMSVLENQRKESSRNFNVNNNINTVNN